jgi:signal transduction histidine kinase
MEILPGSFDREFTLSELLGGISQKRLSEALAALLGAGFRLSSSAGEVLAGTTGDLPGGVRVAVRHDLEVLGWLEAVAAEDQVRAAATLLELLLHQGARYHMASALHIEVVRADYEALQASEARYRELSQQLEERVRQQVEVIKSTQLQLYQAEKMASIGQLAAGVAHEINNPIGFIRSNLGTARGYVERLEELAPAIRANPPLAEAWKRADMDFLIEDFGALLKESIDGADRVARIVADLKGFSNVDHAEVEVVDLNDSLRSVCNVAHAQVSPKAEVIMDLGELPPLHCHAGRLNQVFLSLLLNAAHAMDTRGEIRIRSRHAGNELRIEFIDTGHGIAQDVLERIFDPFFTTRDVGQGTGLGLTVSRDVVAAHGGRIEVQSAPGKGSAFTIVLPAGGCA